MRVIVDPREFYQELLDKARGARERISISSLYLGTGKLEEQLVIAWRWCLLYLCCRVPMVATEIIF